MTNKAGMTARQAELLAFIRQFQKDNGFVPSYDEMKDALKLSSKSGVCRIVDCLEGRGHLVRAGRGSRSLKVVDEYRPRTVLASQLATVARNAIERAVHEGRPVRPGELEAALLAVLP